MTAFNYTHTHSQTHTHSLVAQECPGSVPPSANREADKATKIKGAQHDYVLDNCEGTALMWHSVCPSGQTHTNTKTCSLWIFSTYIVETFFTLNTHLMKQKG